MSNPTQEQFDKQAFDNRGTRKKQGFVHHMKAAGVSDARTAQLLKTYEQQDTHRTNKVEEMRAAILGK
jgi:anti-sigma28 factor (negative regulator of flagellin synthesis)